MALFQSKSELESKIRKSCANMIYIFIEDSMLSTTKYFGKWTSRIKAKKTAQKRYLLGLTYSVTGMAHNLDEIYEWIKDEIALTYEKLYNPVTGQYETATPNLVIYHLCQGDEINGIQWSQGIFGFKVGDTSVADALSASSALNPSNYTTPVSFESSVASTGTVTVNPGTGEMYVGGKSVKTISNYDIAKQTKRTISYFDKTTGETFTVKKKNGTWVPYSVSNSSGTTKLDASTGSTATITQSMNNFWDNINNILGQITELINNIASALSGESAQSLSPSQVEDGWVTEDSGSGISTAALIAGGLLVTGVVLNNDKKSKKTNKEA